MASKKGSKKASKKASKKVSKKTSKKVSKKTSKKKSKKTIKIVNTNSNSESLNNQDSTDNLEDYVQNTEINDSVEVSESSMYNNLDDEDFVETEELVLVNPEERITRNLLTRYEMTRVLGERTKQLIMGAKPLIKNNSGLSYKDIALEELKLNMIPYKIRRPINNKYEIWDLKELRMDHLNYVMG